MKRLLQRAWTPLVPPWVCLFAWIGFPGAASADSLPVSEYHVKAAFLYNFPKFVEWPDEVKGLPEDLITVGVLGEDPFGSVLEQTLEGKTARGRKFRVLRFPGVDDLRLCHVLFVNLPDPRQVETVLDALSNLPALTVGEGREFISQGGMIGLFLEGNKIRFEINAAAARRAGLEIRAPLLQLARSVRE